MTYSMQSREIPLRRDHSERKVLQSSASLSIFDTKLNEYQKKQSEDRSRQSSMEAKHRMTRQGSMLEMRSQNSLHNEGKENSFEKEFMSPDTSPKLPATNTMSEYQINPIPMINSSRNHNKDYSNSSLMGSPALRLQ